MHGAFEENCGFLCPEPSSSQLKVWAASVKHQENETMARQRNTANVTEQVEVGKTETVTETSFCLPLMQSACSDDTYVPATEALKQGHIFHR